jgi:protein arginine kinase
VVQVAERENKVRRRIVETNQEVLKDRVYRSHGVLANAYKISFEEALDLLSNVRFGVYMGIIELDIDKLNNLMIKIQPAHIQELENRKMDTSQRDVTRARIIKDTVKS